MKNILLLHLLVVPFSVALAAGWANQLLAVRKQPPATATVQLALGDLQDQPKPSEDVHRQAPATRPEAASEAMPNAASLGPTAEDAEPPGSDKPTDATQAEIEQAVGTNAPTTDRSSADENATEFGSSQPTVAAPAEPTEREGRGTVAERLAAASVTEPPLAAGPASDEASGGVGTSLHGAGLATETTGTMTGRDAGGGPSWQVRLDPRLSLRALQAIPQTQLVAVRLRREYTEVAPIVDGRVREPQRLEQYLKTHRQFAGQRGVLLEHHGLDEFREQLVAYRGGWEPWLLLEDDLHRTCCDQMRLAVEARGVAWKDAACITTQLTVASTNRLDRLLFVLREVERRPDEPTAEPPVTAPPAAQPLGG